MTVVVTTVFHKNYALCEARESMSRLFLKCYSAEANAKRGFSKTGGTFNPRSAAAIKCSFIPPRRRAWEGVRSAGSSLLLPLSDPLYSLKEPDDETKREHPLVEI